MNIRPYQPEDQAAVIDLWQSCSLVMPWNNPCRDIARKLSVSPELFLVGVLQQRLVATAMAGYDGHRGWVNYLAVEPMFHRQGLGRAMMEAAERRLAELGCPKINIQVRSTNDGVLRFYERLGYQVELLTSLGKRLEDDAN
jgi:ribosomal protein S18 acetylase RimI-like enzyme